MEFVLVNQKAYIQKKKRWQHPTEEVHGLDEMCCCRTPIVQAMPKMAYFGVFYNLKP